jgi:hypothetical protein
MMQRMVGKEMVNVELLALERCFFYCCIIIAVKEEICRRILLPGTN